MKNIIAQKIDFVELNWYHIFMKKITIIITLIIFAGAILFITSNSNYKKTQTAQNSSDSSTNTSKDERAKSPKFKKCQSGKDDCMVLVVVDSKTSNAINAELGQFKNDLVNDGYKPVMIESVFSTPEEVKKEMQKYKDSVEGAILIGNIPFARMADPAIVANPTNESISLISDNYYSDIQGFCDKKINFYYDVRVCQKPTLLYPYIWIGRITASKAGSDGVKQLKDYFKRNHEYRIGQKIDPTRILYVVQDNLLLGVSEIGLKNEFTRKDISVSKWKSSDITTLVSKKDNKQEFLNKIRENYSIANILVHGSNAKHSYNITSQDIENIKPGVAFIDLLSCSTADMERRNGTFVQNYLAGEYLFSGSSLVVKASPVVHFESMPPQQQPFIKAVALGNSFGEAMRIDWQGAYILLGDPTLNFASKRVDAELEVSQKEIDLGTIVFEKDYSFKEGRSATDEKITNLTFKNIGNEIIEFQPTINYVAEGLSNVTKTIKPNEEITISYKSYGHRKILNEAFYVPRNGQQYIEPLYILTDSKTKPIIQIDFKYTAKVI